MNDDRSIIVENFSVCFRLGEERVQALRNVSTILPAGKVVALIGGSGSGKSVLGMSILRLLPDYGATQGSVFYRGRDLLGLDRGELVRLRREELKLIPQNPSQALNPYYSLGRQIDECFPGGGHRQRGDELLRALGFSGAAALRRSYPFELSGGMKQRIASLFGMAGEPAWIIADEPTKGLDTVLRKQVFKILGSMTAAPGRGMLLITHDIPLAEALADEVRILRDGEIVEGGPVGLLGAPRSEYTKELLSAVMR